MPSLGNDLASIRNDLNLSIEDIHQSTRIPVAILESIEDDSIFTTLDENKTYIRSYIRSYARALKIDDDHIIAALDQQEAGIYSGFIGKGEEPNGLIPENMSAAPQEQEPASEEPPPSDRPDESPSPANRKEESPEQIESPPTVNSIDWADVGKRFTPLQAKSRMWVIVILLLTALAALGSYLVYQNYFQNGESDSQSASNTAPETETPTSDSLELDFVAPTEDSTDRAETTAADAEPAALEALPDTLTLVVYAAHGILEPVRVYTDVNNSLNPYWIEQGEAYRFEFVNTIRIRGQYSRMELLFNGHAINNFRQRFLNDETGMLEIDRSVFEDDPSWLQPPPDSLNIDAPPPAIIRERPIFN